MSGTYQDTALIYAESRCQDPDVNDAGRGRTWKGLPVPHPGDTVVLVQVESLDFAALGMKVNGEPVLPFLDFLAGNSLVLRVFAPHKVGSSNSDYEILNGRIADQNVIYYSYIKEYPDSVIRRLREAGYMTSIVHGLDGKLFNLRKAYSAQGFEILIFKEELLEAGYKPGAYIMEHVLDRDVFDMAGKELATGGRQAQFIITMSSHIPFIPPLPEFKSAGGTFARYVSSLRYADGCLADFYDKLPDGAVFIVWGDHGSDVRYPEGYPGNGRHVPFIVHVKGDDAWLRDFGGRKKIPSEGNVYSLCTLAHYLRRLALKAGGP